MEAKIQYFQSPVFGQIRVTVIDDKPMFVANDVAAMLGYSNRYDAINRHCKGVVKHEGVSITTNQYIRGNTKSKTNYTYDIDIQQIKEDRKKYEKSQCFPFASHFGLKRG